MSRTSLLYGKQALLDEYNDRVTEKLSTKSRVVKGTTNPTIGFMRGIRQMRDDNDTYAPFGSYLGASLDTGGIFDAKKEFYRLISLLLSDLGLIFDIRSPSPWQVISELVTQKIIDESESARFKMCLSIANEIRLKTYIENNAQKEVFSPVPFRNTGQSIDDTTFVDFDEDTVVRLLSSSTDISKRCLYFTLKYFRLYEIDTSILRKHAFPSSNTFVKGVLYYRLQNFPKALEWLELIPKDSPEYSGCLDFQGMIYGEYGEDEKSLACHEKALDLNYQNKANSNLDGVLSCTFNLARRLTIMGKHKEARIKLEETIKKLDELRGEGLGQTPIPCDLMINLGRTYHKDGDMKSAIEIYQQAEKMQNRLTSSRDRSVLTLNLYMAESFAESDQRANAVEYIKRAVELGHKLYGNRNLSIKLAEIYAFAGHVYGRCSLDDEALSLLNRSLELLQILLGDKPHPGKMERNLFRC